MRRERRTDDRVAETKVDGGEGETHRIASVPPLLLAEHSVERATRCLFSESVGELEFATGAWGAGTTEISTSSGALSTYPSLTTRLKRNVPATFASNVGWPTVPSLSTTPAGAVHR